MIIDFILQISSSTDKDPGTPSSSLLLLLSCFLVAAAQSCNYANRKHRMIIRGSEFSPSNFGAKQSFINSTLKRQIKPTFLVYQVYKYK